MVFDRDWSLTVMLIQQMYNWVSTWFLCIFMSVSSLNPAVLKLRTGEFDIESIHHLDLSDMGKKNYKF